jgi:peptidoglycan/LPS O-acetylase OafA/YrhL
MTIVVGFMLIPFSKINHILRNAIAIVFVTLLWCFVRYFTKTTDETILNNYYLYGIFPFCVSFLITALVYGWIDAIKQKTQDKQLILVTIVVVSLILLAYISYRKGWDSIVEATNMYVILPLIVSTIVNSISSSYMKIKQKGSRQER